MPKGEKKMADKIEIVGTEGIVEEAAKAVAEKPSILKTVGPIAGGAAGGALLVVAAYKIYKYFANKNAKSSDKNEES